ncbi:MAG TPA: hypothetical protein VFP68_06045 [Burkholderiaceae bacterium]|nr:hypothetical protein [Burkholderiaceae bacterium]
MCSILIEDLWISRRAARIKVKGRFSSRRCPTATKAVMSVRLSFTRSDGADCSITLALVLT